MHCTLVEIAFTAIEIPSHIDAVAVITRGNALTSGDCSEIMHVMFRSPNGC